MNERNKMKEIRDKFERKPREIWISSKNIFAIDLSDIIHRFKSQILVVYARCYLFHPLRYPLVQHWNNLALEIIRSWSEGLQF